ncbi:Flagellar hook protein FlgE (plasmid) [Rhodovastum atsumiense]|uniref:flagellar hook protein FlgE n=1 Tax=Rhodovastum atsumiense TaxID=504468 RepID=UPI0020252384|nr:flagellar hook-basal body complex protein [Rhodovastum atsumiense]CAH2605524.1 Flagellar hook protein FlgE [Rhodovastum atsumiense]
MTLLNAINSALSGLNAESQRLSAISNNVANSSTVGYKKTETLFESMVLNGTASSGSNLAGVHGINRMDIASVGQMETTGITTDLAVNGNGFFVVNTKADNSGEYLASRAGSFRPDASGNLVNTGGYYLQGIQLDSAGQPVTNATDSNITSLGTVNIGNLQATASATTKVTFNANLPSTDISDWSTTSTQAQTAHTSSVQYYDALGNAQTLTITFQPVFSTPTTPTANTWNMVIQDTAKIPATAATGTISVWGTDGTSPTNSLITTTGVLSSSNGDISGQAKLTFNGAGSTSSSQPAGTLSAVDATTSIYPVGTAPTYDSTTGDFTITTGAGRTLKVNVGVLNSSAGMTQYAGAYSATKIEKDGASFGMLQGVSVDGDGKVIASFSNGSTRPIYQLELALFTNPDGLSAVSGGAFAMDPAAGVPRLFKPGQGPAGATEGGALEGSNVDISTELTRLIQTQRAYSSSATVIQTSNQMLDVANRLNQ